MPRLPYATRLSLAALAGLLGQAATATAIDAPSPAACLDRLPPVVAADDPEGQGLFLRTVSRDRWRRWQATPPAEAWLAAYVAAANDLEDLHATANRLIGEAGPRLGAIDAVWWLANRAPNAATEFFACLGALGQTPQPATMSTDGERERITLLVMPTAGGPPARVVAWAAINAVPVGDWPEGSVADPPMRVVVERVPGDRVTVLARLDAEAAQGYLVWQDVPWGGRR